MNAYDQQQLYQLAHKAQLKAHKLYKGRKRTARVKNAKRILALAAAAPAVSNSQLIGKQAESIACQYLQNQGLVLLQQNLQCKTGEIDLIMQHNNTLIFLEVRQRNNSQYGGSAASISNSKKQRLCKAALYFLPYIACIYFNDIIPPARFDVIAIDSDRIQWIQQAFELQN